MNNTGIAMAVGFAALTGLGGFFLGQGTKQEVDESATTSISSQAASSSTAAKTQGERRGGVAVEPNLRGYDLSKNPRQGLETLLEELRQSPMAQMDFEALFGIWDMIQYLDGVELASLMADLEEMGGGQEMMAVRMMLLNRWAAKDGPAAMESVFEGEKGMMQMVGAMGAMMGWMRSDPEQAYAWFQENGDRLGSSAMGMGKEQIEAMYFANMAKTDFDGTMAKLDGMDNKMKKAVIQQLSQSAVMDEDHRNELLGYLKEKEEDSLLKDARRSIVQQMAWQDPKAAIAFIDSENPDAETREELVGSATAMWSHTDPKGAIEYQSQELAGQENAGDKIASTFGQWVAQDEAGAAEWLAGQSDEFKTDSVFTNAGRSLVNSGEYDRAGEWYGQVLDENTRKMGYTDLYDNWKDVNPEEADGWRKNLPAEDLSFFSEPDVQELFAPEN